MARRRFVRPDGKRAYRAQGQLQWLCAAGRDQPRPPPASVFHGNWQMVAGLTFGKNIGGVNSPTGSGNPERTISTIRTSRTLRAGSSATTPRSRSAGAVMNAIRPSPCSTCIDRTFRFGSRRVRPYADFFKIGNSDVVVSHVVGVGSTYLAPSEIVAPHIIVSESASTRTPARAPS